MSKQLVVNLFGGPSAGKSTTAAGVFYKLKTLGVKCELVTEYAKSRVWEEALTTLDDQIYIFGKQHHRQFTLINKVDVMITDSPLLLSLHYGASLPDCFKELVLETFNNYDNMNYFLRGIGEFDQVGRMQDEKGCEVVSKGLMSLLDEGHHPYKIMNDRGNTIYAIVDDVLKKIVL